MGKLYYIVCLTNGHVHKTDSTSVANEYSEDEDYIVIDPETDSQIVNGEAVAIK